MSTAPTTHAGDASAAHQDLAARFRAWLTRPTAFDGIFPPAARRLGVIYVGVTVPLIAAVSLPVDDDRSYIFMFAFSPLVLYGLPSLVLSVMAIRRAPVTTTDRPSYLLWFAGAGLFCIAGVGLLGGLATPMRWANVIGRPITVLIAALLLGGIVRLTRSRSGLRRLSVDMTEAAMAVVVVASPCILIWGSRIVNADESWFTVPAGLTTVGMIFGTYWALALVVRLGPNAGTLELCGLAICVVGTANAAAQVAQGLSGFTLPAPPIIAVHSFCMGMSVLVPLHLTRTPRAGLDRLPPEAQVRVGYFSTLITLAGLPVLVLTTVAVDESTSWAPPFALGVATLLVVLAGLRHLAGIHETRQLYAQVAAASRQRHALLGQLVERADEERHRVATHLHEQAVSAYTSVVMLQGSYGASGPKRATPVGAAAGEHVRHDLANLADSLRDLMLAIQPPTADRSGTRTLAAPIYAYLDSLYGDDPAPRLGVTTAGDLFIDWATETILLRIVQEALRNVRQHSEARNIEITIGADGGAAVARITDDGKGFDPGADDLVVSGIATMQAFAAVVHGSVRVESAPGQGTTVVARLGGPPGGSDRAAAGAGDAPPAGDAGGTEPTGRRPLRLVTDHEPR